MAFIVIELYSSVMDYTKNLVVFVFCLLMHVCVYRVLKSRVKILVDGTLLISGLIPEDSGNYTCTPTNGLMTPPSASAYLKVKRECFAVFLNIQA